jgi:hypothetical protein
VKKIIKGLTAKDIRVPARVSLCKISKIKIRNIRRRFERIKKTEAGKNCFFDWKD